MGTKKPYKVYELYKGKEKVYIGVTNDAERRKIEHSRDKKFDKMKIVSSLSSEEKAKALEEERLKNYKRNHKGKLPKYNDKI